MQNLLEKFDLEKEKKFLFIFDVDGTLRPDTVEALDHRYPKINPDTAKQLMELNTVSGVEIKILTARSYVDILRSNFPKNIIKYCGFGKQIIRNGTMCYAKEEFYAADLEISMFIELLKDILGPKLTANIDFLTTPGDFSIYFEANDYEEQKIKMLEIIDIVIMNSKRWKLLDFGREVVFKDSKYPYSKGDAIFDILNGIDLSELTRVCFFGDSQDDYKAMSALRDYQKLHPQKRLKVTNVAVGGALKGSEYINEEFESYKDTLNFVSALHGKLV